MMKRGGIAVLVLGALAAGPAQAGDKQDFERCDGRVHPGKQEDGMRGSAGEPRFPFPGAQAGVVEACDRALASPRLLPTQTLRRAHLLRARAAARLGAGDAAGGLADLDGAEAALGAGANDPFIRRSMGVSLTLLRAIAKAQAGDAAAAAPLARAAAAARPYSLQVQQVAAGVLDVARPAGDGGASPWTAVSRLEPDAAVTALVKAAEAGDFAGAIALAPTAKVEWPAGRVAPLAFVARTPDAAKLVTAAVASAQLAYARAATGDPAGARRDLADLRARVAAARPEAPAAGATGLPAAASLSDGLDKYVDARARQVEARVAVAEGRPADAIAALVAAPMPRDAATVELLRAIKAAVPSKDAGLIPDLAPFERRAADERREALASLVPDALIAPETPRVVVDYARARPNILGALVAGALSMGTSLLGGISRTDGFRSTNHPDGTITVEFIGNTPSAALVGEMTLLRAAEVARAAGKPRFVIVERREYRRRLVTSQYGREIGSTPTGFKTELTIRPVDAVAEPGRALDAVAIIDALGPLYYQKAA